jgi:deazaflavin-dependent oxidoreductase (nitroreductase family)
MNSSPTAVAIGQARFSGPVRWLARAVQPLASPLAGNRWFPLWAILRHTGRTSGKSYSIPVVALKTPDGFMIPLPFGDATQWVKNVLSAGGGSLRFAGREYQFTEPRVVDHDVAAQHLPRVLRFVTARIGLRQYVLVRSVTSQV